MNNQNAPDDGAINLVLQLSMVELSKFYEAIPQKDRYDVIRHIEAAAIRLLRIAIYLEARNDMAVHESAVKDQNRIIKRVRNVLGYTYPTSDIHF